MKLRKQYTKLRIHNWCDSIIPLMFSIFPSIWNIITAAIGQLFDANVYFLLFDYYHSEFKSQCSFAIARDRKPE